MTKERLEEIKDSANLQLALAEKLNFDNNTIELISEEIELLDYINDLQQRIEKAVEELQELYNLYKDDDCYTIGDKLENALNILKGDDTNES